ncbi:HlyD family efflux transporter periplasmic adaptor subunit [Iningainema tapete]|uniref:HlyD family efflux transporter periplasmic adaptor subunit n=1 Tax=Iningainema tapete BLCC-T55 TaxID=2748662 RepID=A0A8J6XFM8_9CYAN|nr:HlyD family efflux transporter periplasmic adaptor subunit [Iningainema tapete]MBD2773153.1 HlyD family efflux transporter periplasmic adaptor subunit [Iningainema tapete BLCC-T55]
MNIQYTFDQPVLLKQSPTWSRVIAWGIVGITAFTVIWASVFKIDEAVPATGKLEPQGAVTDIQAPVNGVVKLIHVKDGQQVKKGDILISLEQTTAIAQLKSLQQNRASLVQENQYYRQQLSKNPTYPTKVETSYFASLQIPPEIATLTQSRAAIIAENQVYRSQLNNSTTGIVLTPDQQLRLRSRQLDFNSRITDIKLEIEKTQAKLTEGQLQLASAKDVLAINRKIIQDMEPVVKEGAIARSQFLVRQQEVLKAQAEVDRLTKEQQQLKLAIIQAKEKIRNTEAISKEDLLSRITANEKSIAEIDSQLTRIILENQKKINDIDSQLAQAQTTLKYQKITSPISGTVFELKAKTPGFVANSSEPILKIVPNDNLVAKVHITNKDIGFVQQGQKVDVRIDSFPFQEYGDIKGELISIGSDALPPDQLYPFYRFPAKVRLSRQTLLINHRELPLQSGMSINANIKLRQRTVMSIFTDFLVQKTESLKFVR